MMATKEKKNSHLKDLLLLLAVPLTIILVAAAIVYVPRLAANPKFDFVYALCTDYRCAQTYTVTDGRIAQKDAAESNEYMGGEGLSSLYYYDVAQSSSRVISLQDAQKLRLNPSSKSPDGYTLNRDDTSSGFLFWNDYDRDWYLKDGAKKKKVDLANTSSYYSDNVTFLGWVEK